MKEMDKLFRMLMNDIFVNMWLKPIIFRELQIG
jgi:hypothetical protein